MLRSALVVVATAQLSLVANWLYFRRFRMTRPAVGVLNLYDAAIGIAMLLVLPYLYLTWPLWLVGGVLLVAVVSGLYFVLEPALSRRAVLWSVCLGLVAADVALGLAGGVGSTPFLVVNNVTMVLVVLGAANLWAQSGISARDVAVLSAVLTGYDAVATWQLGVTLDLFIRLSQLPLFPMLAWGLGDVASTVQIGLGDLLLAGLFPLVARKAFGRSAGLVAMGFSSITIVAVIALVVAGVLGTTIPVMVLLGPLIVAQYAYWRSRRPERPTWRYLQAEPLSTPG